MGEPDKHGFPMVECFARFSRAAASVWSEASKLHVRVPGGAAIESEVKEKVSHYLRQAAEPSSALRRDNEGLVCLTAGQSGRANLICVHASHGSVYDYRFQVSEVDHRYPVYALHALRHLIARRDILMSLQALAETHVREMLGNQVCEVPYVLYGVSSGGLLALEMAIQLSAHGRAPAALVLGDTRDLMRSASLPAHLGERYVWLTFVAAYLPISLLPLMLTEKGAELWSCADDASRCRLLAQRASEMTDPTYAIALEPGELAVQLQAHRHFLRAYYRYQPRPYSGNSVFLKGTAAGPELSEGVRASLPAGHRIAEIQGNHMSLLSPGGGRMIASLLEQELQSAAGA
jgi:thioesterase domain-containing protein